MKYRGNALPQPRYAALLAMIAATLAMPSAANAQLLLDDFSTGAYGIRLASGRDVNTQSGLMVGGERLTAFLVCPPGPCGDANPFDQEAGLQIRPGRPSALIYSAGYKAAPRVDVQYGANTPLQLDLDQYDRFRVSFDGSDLGVNFNIQVFTPSARAQLGCNLESINSPVSIDFPFVDFVWEIGAPDFTDISTLGLIFQSGSVNGSNDFAVTSFQAIPAGAPPAPIICH